MEITLIAALIISISANLYLFFRKKTQKRSLTIDARQLLHDLTHGGAIVSLHILDPQGVMIYRSVE